MPVFRERVRDAFMVISVFSEWPESLGSLAALCQKHYLTTPPREHSSSDPLPRAAIRDDFPSSPFCLLIYRNFTTSPH